MVGLNTEDENLSKDLARFLGGEKNLNMLCNQKVVYDKDGIGYQTDMPQDRPLSSGFFIQKQKDNF